MENLKPCPFCGGTGDTPLHWEGVYCRECGCLTDSIAAWNRRADNWISVEDRLPREDDANEYRQVWVYLPASGKVQKSHFMNLTDWPEVSHWLSRQKPQPPKEASDES